MEKLAIELNIEDPNKICRICLSAAESSQLWNLYGNSIVDGYIIAIPDIIKYTLDIQVTDDGEQLPKKICDQCKSQIIQYHAFKSKSDRINKILNQDSPKSNQSSSSLSSIQHDIVNSELIIDDINLSNQLKREYIEEDDDGITTINDNNNDTVIKKFKFTNNDIDVENADTKINDNSDIVLSDGKQPETMENNEIFNEINDDLTIENEVDGENEDINNNDDDRVVDHIDYESNDDTMKYYETEIDNDNAEEEEGEAEDMNERNEEYNEVINIQQIELKLKRKNQSKITEKQNTFYCAICNLNWNNRNQFYEHCVTKEHPLFCRKCCKLFRSDGFYYRHLKKYHNVNNNDDDADDDDNNVTTRNTSNGQVKSFNCDQCDEKFTNQVAYNQHIHLHKTLKLSIDQCELYACRECFAVYLTNDQLKVHTGDKHCNDNEYIDYQFLTDGNSSCKCGICNGEFSSYNELKLHIITHLTVFKCPISECGRTYENIKHLNLHIMSKHPMDQKHNNQLTCRFCNKTAFPTSIALQDHMQMDCVEKKFDCPHCDKKFFSQKSLTHHLNFANKQKKHMCQLCGKTFTQPIELRIHTRSHTGERPYACTKCDKTYKTLSTLSLHMESHNNENSYECNLCKRILHTRQSYRNHTKRHTQEKNQICDVCGKKFFTRHHLRLHVQKIHEKQHLPKKVIVEDNFDVDDVDDVADDSDDGQTVIELMETSVYNENIENIV